jgi:mitochondrial enoyl-[acyl-carrier protein] reductase / trans-2-enoyl-CoA reductase
LKALIQTDYGDPAKVLQLRDVPDVQAGADEVVIAMETAVVHAADARTVLGAEGFRKKLPRTPGYEGVGRVLRVGHAVKDFEPGARVFAPIGVGTFREQIVAPAAGLKRAPEGDPVQLAVLSAGPATALLMLQDFVTLAEGDWVVQNAANSPVGRLVIQIANEMKLRVVNVVKSSPVISELKEIGAGAVLLDTDDLRDRVAAVTQGAPIRLGLDAVAGEATTRLAGCLSDDATIVNYGSLSGEPCQLPWDVLTMRGIRLCGMNPARQLARHTEEECKAIDDRIAQMLVAGRLHARIAATFNLDDAIEAIRHAAKAGDKRFGKVVLRISHISPPASATEPPPPQETVAAAPADPAQSAEAPAAPAEPEPATAA